MPSSVADRAGTGTVAAPPAFLLTIDTEGDNVWVRPREVTTRNTRYLPRFQSLCERFGLQPTYLVNYEMAHDPAFVEFGADLLRRGTAEIGMHLHAWDTPPIEPLGERDWHDQPYAIHYPPALVTRKIEGMTRLLEDRFGVPITSHRSGRWGFDAHYGRALATLGYRVDCSVTPLVTWAHHPGHPDGRGGPDFSRHPAGVYRLGDGDDTALPGHGPLLEVPMTIMTGPRPWHRELARRLLGRRGPRVIWLRPDATNRADLLFIAEAARQEARDYIQFTLHSSEFMPGGSPTFQTDASIETLYADMEALFATATPHFKGSTLTAFADRYRP